MRNAEQIEGRRAQARRLGEVPVRDMVPSQRDLLRAIGRRRRSLAFIATVHSEGDVQRALDAAVSALAAPDLVLRTAATARPPLLAVEPCVTRSQALAARLLGADAILVPACLPSSEIELIMAGATSARMTPVLDVQDEGELMMALELRPRALLVATPELARAVRPPLVVIGMASDAASARAFAGLADAVLASPELLRDPKLQAIVAELDR